MKNLFRNFPHSKEFEESSFLGLWHEKDIWDAGEYWKLDAEIYELSAIYSGESIPREIAWPLMRIYSYLMVTIQAHYNENDGFRVSNLTEDQMFNFRERLQLVVEGFFSGNMPKNENFDLINPLLAKYT